MKLFTVLSSVVLLTLAGCEYEETSELNAFSPAEMYIKCKDYFVGNGVPQNESLAVELCRRSAEEGYAPAQYYMGFLYFSGNSVNRNSADAVKYYRMAADQGIVEAQAILGSSLYKNRDLPLDQEEAIKYLIIAATHDPESMTELAKLYLDGDIMPRKNRRAAELLHTASGYKYVPALVMLGRMYLHGTGGILTDHYKGLNLLHIAADQKNNEEALIALSEAYFAGLGVEQNASVALEFLVKAADEGSDEAAGRIADYYWNDGEYGKAAYWFNRLAEKNDLSSQVRLAEMYSTGMGVDKNEVLALDLYEKARRQGYKDGEYVIAVLLSHMPQRRDEALRIAEKLYARASEENNVQNLAKLYYFYGDRDGINDTSKARDLLEKIKETGDYGAVYQIGSDLYSGAKGLTEDKDGGRNLVMLSAWAGIADAEYTVGLWKEEGAEGRPDKIAAYAWYQVADTQPEAVRHKKALKLNRRELRKAQEILKGIVNQQKKFGAELELMRKTREASQEKDESGQS